MRGQPDAQEKYISETFTVDDEHLRRIKEALKRDGLYGIQVASSDARILQTFTRLIQAQRVVEIGTLYGYSTLCLARALPVDGRVISVDVSEKNHAMAQSLLKETESWSKIRLVKADAKSALAEISSEGPFDLVFVDADKAGYLQYLDWAETNVRRGGLIIGDNTFLFGALFGESRDPDMGERQIAVMREFNRRLADSARYNSCLIPTSEGITVAQKLF